MIGTKHGILVAALALAAVTLAACGSDNNDNGSPQTPSGRSVRFASLNGTQETPSVTTSAVGGGVLSVDEATGAARGFVVTTGLANVTQAHIHQAARGTPGSVILPLTGGPDLWVVPDGSTLTPAQVAAYKAGNLYFNVHTSANTNGEIRGQIDKSGTVKLASMNGAQDAVTTDAFGGGLLSVDDATGQVAGFIVTSGLTATLAHVHQQARGTAGSVIVPLVGGPNVWVVADDRAPLTADQRAAFTAGNLYYNAHTAANPNGEIRGQLDKSGTLGFAAMSGAQETPAVATTAFGAGVLAVDGASGAVAGFIATAGLTATLAHVHQQARGTPGSVIVPLSGGPNVWVVADDRAALTADQRAAFTAGNLYYNAHTTANPNGEIRGQLE